MATTTTATSSSPSAPTCWGRPTRSRRASTELVDHIKATPKQKGVDEIRIPSERAFRARERALREGLEIDRLVFDALVALREKAR